MKNLFLAIALLGSGAHANGITYWSGSGTSQRSENGKVWETLQCDKTLGMYTQVSRRKSEFLIISGGLCYRLDIGVALKNESGNLVLTKDTFGFTAPWTSDDIGKYVGKMDDRSFNYSFKITNADNVSFIIKGKMETLADGRTADILFSNETLATNGDRYKIEVSGIVTK